MYRMKQEISLYFHIPFCKRKCGYCHFYSFYGNKQTKKKFLKNLQIEWEQKKQEIEGKKIVSLYFGGGTPSSLSPNDLENILSWINNIPSSCEITLEVNPEDVSQNVVQQWKKIGINRISLGVQSFDPVLLKILGRKHSALLAKKAIETLSENNVFENISIDLMYDLPKQTLKSWKETLLYIKNLSICHVSLYNLTIEPNTLFHKKQKEFFPFLPKEKLSLSFLQEALSFFEEIGFERYEISAFAKNKKYFSKHNLGYWTRRQFLGFGPSAFSYWQKKRFSNVPNFSHYCKALQEGKSPKNFEEKLSFPANVKELLVIHLRLIDGVDLKILQEKEGKLPTSTMKSLKELEKKHFLVFEEKNHCRLTKKGLLFYDTIAQELI